MIVVYLAIYVGLLTIVYDDNDDAGNNVKIEEKNRN